MAPEEFRQAGYQLIDWIVDYRENIETQGVKSQVAPGEIKQRFELLPPTQTTGFAELLTELEQVVVTGVTHVQHPMHFGWFPSNSSLSAVLGDIASSGLGTLGISWESCPALTEVEEVVCDWLRQLTGLSDQWHGSIQDTASTACLTAMIIARERASDYAQMSHGLQSIDKPLTVYATAESHSSVEKAISLAGFGQQHVRWVDVDKTTRQMDVEHLQQLVEQDIEQGFLPCLIIASAGTTGVTAFDPIESIASIATKHTIWLHVDAAMAGSAMLLEECRHLWNGVDLADSLSWNPHKWLGTTLDCSLFYVRDCQHLVRVMSTNPSYLRSAADGAAVQYRDWGIPLGRRFRALKLLFQLRLDGVEALQNRLRRDLANAQWLAQQIQQTDDWQVMYPVTLQTLCIRHCPSDMSQQELNQYTLSWLNEINQSGVAFMSPTKVEDSWLVRVSIGVESTTREHVARLWRVLQETVSRVAQS